VRLLGVRVSKLEPAEAVQLGMDIPGA
jgi:hypothetical protein